jgi:hypothetical protein
MSISFTAIYGATLPASRTITASYTGDGLVVGTPPGTTLPSWLSVAQSGASGKTVTLSVSVGTTRATPGPRSVTLRFVTGRSDGTDLTWVDVPVTYTIVDDLVLSPAQLALTANDGTVATRQVQVSLASGAGGVPWTAMADPGLHLTSSTGAAGTPVEVSYDAQAQALPPGAATLNVQVSVVISGATVTKVVPVSLDVGPHWIYAVRNGVALTSVPGVSRLAATVPLVDNAGVNTGTWSASGDQPWLVVDGIQGDTVAIHADPTGLSDGFYVATLTVSSTGPRVEGPDRVTVGLFVSSTPPVEGLLATDAGQGPVPDPIRPWVWLVSPSDRSKVAAYNVYSGAIEKQLTLPAAVSAVAVSGDGSTLYAGGMAAAGGYTDIARVTIDTGAALPAFAGQGHPVVETFRPGGREFVVTSDAAFYDAATGIPKSGSSVFWSSFGWHFTVSADQRYLYGISTGVSPTSLGRARIGLSGSAAALSFTGPSSTTLLNELGVGRLAVTPDGSAVCFADHRSGSTSNPFGVFGPNGSGGLVSLGTFLGSTPTDPTIAVDIAPDGRVLAVAGYTIDCYGALLGTLTHSYALPSAQASAWSIRFSGDGERAVVAGWADGYTQALWAYPAR